MPLTYRYDEKLNILHSHQNGKLSFLDFMGLYEKISKDSIIARGCAHVIHASGIEGWLISPEDAFSIAEKYLELSKQKKIKITIYVATNELSFGISRMMSVLLEMKDPARQIEIVDTEMKANKIICGFYSDLKLNS